MSPNNIFRAVTPILKITSRIFGFIYWNYKKLIQSDKSITDDHLLKMIEGLKAIKYSQSIPEIENIRSNFTQLKSSINNTANHESNSILKIVHENKNEILKHVNSSSSPLFNAIMLKFLCNHNKSKNVLELGTSIGISSAYMAYNAELLLDTVDQNKIISKIAQTWHKELNINNITYYRGSFSECLPKLLQQNRNYDFIFIDGDHTYHSTIDNFELLLQHCSKNAIIVIDDIYWSWEMQKAWYKIIDHPSIKWSINLYHFGIVGLESFDDTTHHLFEVPNNYYSWFARKNNS